MKEWHISDIRVIEALRKNGFVCKINNPSPIRGAINISGFNPHTGITYWHVTDCPVKWNESYTLPDGQVIISHGTSLYLQESEQGDG